MDYYACGCKFFIFYFKKLVKSIKMKNHCVSGTESFPAPRIKVPWTLADLGPIFQAYC